MPTPAQPLRPFEPPRHAAWMQTLSGYCIDLKTPNLRDLQLHEIATSLARLPRFLGHTLGTEAYTVAQHSCHVADLLRFEPISVQRAGLLHDAHEAIIGDFISPVKDLLGRDAVKDAERDIVVALHERFGLSPGVIGHPSIGHADLLMLATERRDLLRPSAWPWGIQLPAPDRMATLEPWDATAAYVEFLSRAERLGLH